MSVHRRIADLIPSHGEGQLMTHFSHRSDCRTICNALVLAMLAQTLRPSFTAFSTSSDSHHHAMLLTFSRCQAVEAKRHGHADQSPLVAEGCIWNESASSESRNSAALP